MELSDEDTEEDAKERAVIMTGSSNTAFRTSRGNGFTWAFSEVHYEAKFAVGQTGEYDVVLTYSTKPHGAATATGEDIQIVRQKLSPGNHHVAGDIQIKQKDTDYTLKSIELRQPCGKIPPGTPDFRVSSIHAELSLGLGAKQESAGLLRVMADAITSALYSPASLAVATPDGDEVTVVRDGAGSLRQVKAPQALADIVTLDASSYEVRFYTQVQIGAQDTGTLIYAVSGTPYAIFKFENPDAAQSLAERLRITETRGSIVRVNEYAYDTANNTWSLSQGNGLRRTGLAVSTAGTDTSKTITVRDQNDVITSKTTITRRTFAWGEQVINMVRDPDGAALTTSAEYYDNAGSDGDNYGRLKLQTNRDGSWERHTWDASGRPLKTIRPWLDAVSTAAESLCRVTENTYSTLADADGDGIAEQFTTTVEKTLGGETGRRYLVEWSKPVTLAGESFARLSDIRCTAAGAAWDASANLVTETLNYTTDPYLGRTRRTLNPDGTATLATYTLDANGQQTAVTKSGVPNAAQDDITDGTRTVTVTSAQGQVVGETSTDIASNLTLSSWTATLFDPLGRPTRMDFADGTYETRDYACCGLASSRDRTGIVTSYQYDDLGRQTHVTRSGLTTRTDYDSNGRVKSITRIGSDNSEMVQNSSIYDLAGRQTGRRDALNRLTTSAEDFNTGTGHTTRTTTNPGGGTTIEVTARDGSRLSVSGTATAPHNFEYGLESGELFTKEILVGEGGALTEWTKSYTDFAGRGYKTVLADGAVTQSYFNAVGQLVRQVDPDGIATLFTYNAKGEQETVAVDVNANGTIDFAGTDRISKTVSTIATRDTYTVQRSITQVWETDGADTPVTVSVSEQSADGLRSWQTVRGLTSTSVTVLDGSGGRTVTSTAPDGTTNTQVFSNDRLQSLLTAHPSLGTLSSVSYGYDPHGRLATSSQLSALNSQLVTTYTYYADDQTHTATTPDPDASRSGPGYDPQTTSFVYDGAGRLSTVTQPDGGVVNTTYYPTGAVKRTWGSRTYPSEYAYDPQGRAKTLTTWQDFAGNAGQAVTTWNYSPTRGLLSSKVYPDAGSGLPAPSSALAYTYKPSGRLLTRTWARGIVCTYGYNAAGDLTGVDYSDTTPDVTTAYDRAGRPKTITDASGTRTLAYNATGQLEDEAYTAGLLNGLSLDRSFDSLARLSGLSATSVPSVTYSYDQVSRLDTVTAGSNTATYAYVPNSPLVDSITFKQGGTTRLTTTKAYDNLNRLSSISSQPSALSSQLLYAYTYNSANQRTKATREDNAYWNYAYDALGQVTSGKKHLADTTPVNGLDYAWTYDDIGNRKTATVNSQLSTYTPTLLNTYSARTVPGAVDVFGAAGATATVTVAVDSGAPQAVMRQGELFSKQVAVNNASAAQNPTLKITGVKNLVGANGEDAVTEVTKTAFVAQTPEAFAHDADGNLTDDARWHYTWDGENRLVGLETQAGAVTPNGPLPASDRKKLEFAYDGQGRRFSKKVSSWDGSAWQLGSSTYFLYDGWNMLAELNAYSLQPTATFAWGLDLSGSLQGAGGVGGLLFTSYTLNLTPYSAAAAYDGNGNIIGYVDMATGIKSTTYEYNAFGETIVSDGPAAELFSFRFSTHYFDQETGLSYAKNRFIKDGRFLNRDPITEQGGLNLYGFVGNDAVSRVDPFGLENYGGFPGMAPFGFGPIEPIHPPIAPDAYVPGWARVSGNYSITLSTLFGQGGTAAAYFPFPAAPAFGVYAKFDGTMKTGTCGCKDGGKKSYSSLTGTITLGVYAGNPGTEFRITAPFVENLAQCPEPSALKLRGIAQGSVRLGPASFTVSVNGDGNVSFSGSYQVPVNLFTARASIGGGIQGSWAQINN